MIPSKMWLDGNPLNQPKGTTREAFNINNSIKKGSITNDNCNINVSSYNNTTIGVIPTKENRVIIFSSDNKIGLLYNDVYTVLYNNSNLQFSIGDVVTGHFYINNKNEEIIIFRYSKGIKLFNTTTLELQDFINKAYPPTINSTINLGGNLQVGSYIPIIRYVKKDLSTTNFFRGFGVITISKEGAKSGTLSNKYITFNISNIDTNYSFIEFGFIRSVEGVKEAFVLTRLQIVGNSTTISINGSELLIPINIKEVVEDKAIYKNFNYLSVSNNFLLALGVKEFYENNLQTKVNNLNLKWKSELLTLSNPRTAFKNNNAGIKTFAHGEVYNFFVRFRYLWGVSKWYVLIGRDYESGELDDVTISGKTYKKYRVEDTCSITSGTSTSSEGNFSFFRNEAEVYPANGNLPTGQVRHFKFPSVNWFRTNVYNIPEYGTSKYDKLSVYIDTIDLNDFKDSDGAAPISYEIGYSSRNAFNSTFLGQSIVICNNKDTLATPYTSSRFFSTGGNFKIGVNNSELDYTSRRDIRLYPLEALKNQGTSNVTELRNELTLEADLSYSGSRIIADSGNNPLFDTYNFQHVLSNFQQGQSASTSGTIINNIINQNFILNNTIKEDIDNIYSESYFNLRLGVDLPTLIDTNTFAVSSKKVISISSISGKKERAYLTSLLSLNKDCYVGYYNQDILLSDKGEGDCYINIVPIVLYGTFLESYRESVATSPDRDKQGFKEGNVYIKTFVSESIYNIEELINESVKHYPDFDFNSSNLYHVNRDRTTDPNQFNVSVNVDYNVKNNLEFSNIYSPTLEEFKSDDYKIVRSGSFAFNKYFNIREFSRDDYYLADRRKGKPIAIKSDRDFIYIQCQNALFKTVTSNRAALDNTDNLIYLKVGDIFDYPLYEVQHSDYGQLGSYHPYSIINTKYGLITVDCNKKRVSLVSDKIETLSDDGLMQEFKSILNSNIPEIPFTEKSIWSVFDDYYNRLILSIDNTVLIYSFESKGWLCFWTYKPDFMFTTREHLFSLKNNKIYKHNVLNENFNTIYSQSITSSIKLVFNNSEIFTPAGFSFRGMIFKLKATNTNQSTGYVDLKEVDNEGNIRNNSGNVRKFKNSYYFYFIRDYQTLDKLSDKFIEVEVVLDKNYLQELAEFEVL
jgi:hypothetical protein